MKKESLDRIRATVDVLLQKIHETTALFYDHLFATEPDLRAMFRGDMALQRQHFAAALAVILRNLTMLDVLTEPLRQLGANHAAIGVKPYQYPVVRDALIFAMSRTLADRWTPDLADDWRELIDNVSRIMMSGGTSHTAITKIG